MDDRQEPFQSEPRTSRLVDLLGPAASANLLIYIGAVVAGSLPLALLNPFWQLRFIALLVDNGGFALMGFVLLHLAAWFDPQDRRLGLRCNQARALAVAVSLGFLLLIPLQPWASWNSLAGEVRIQAQERRVLEEQFSSWRSALNRATDVQELRARFRALRGPAIGEAEARLPWSQLRQQLLVGLAKARADALRAHAGPSNVQIWGVVQESLRRMVAAFALALAFAAGAQLPGEQRSLLGWWLTSSQERQARRLMRRQQRRQQREQRQRLQENWREIERSRQDQPLAVPVVSAPADGLPGLQYTFLLDDLEQGGSAGVGLAAGIGEADGVGHAGAIGQAGWVGPWWKRAALEDASLLLSIGLSSDGSVGLVFSRPVQLSSFTLAADGVSGITSTISLRQGSNSMLQGPHAWVGGFTYTVEWPALIGPEEPLWLEGAWPQGLGLGAGSNGPGLPLAEITVVEPPPSLRLALKEELDSWLLLAGRLLGRGARRQRGAGGSAGLAAGDHALDGDRD